MVLLVVFFSAAVSSAGFSAVLAGAFFVVLFVVFVVFAFFEDMAKNYGREAKDLEENEALKNYIKGSLETEKAIEFVVKNAKIK